MYFTKDVMYSPIILYVIDYMNPKYMHMQIGKFVEEWTPTQEQSIWDILYRKEGADKLKEMVKVIRPSGRANLTLEYNLLYFIMSDFWVKGLLLSYQSEESEKFQLLENTMNENPGCFLLCASDIPAENAAYRSYLVSAILQSVILKHILVEMEFLSSVPTTLLALFS